MVLAVTVLAWTSAASAQPPPDLQEVDDNAGLAKTWTDGALLVYTIHQDGNEDWTKFTVATQMTVELRFNIPTLGEALLVDVLQQDLTTSVLRPAPAGLWVAWWINGFPGFWVPPGSQPYSSVDPAPPVCTNGWQTVVFRLVVDAGTYYVQVTNDPAFTPTVTLYTIQYVEIPAGGLRVSDQVPGDWTVHWHRRAAPPGISGGLAVHTLLPVGTFISRPYKVTIGLRNAAGNWLGSDPQVVVSDWPVWNKEHHFPFRSFRNLRVPQVEGAVYTVWARMTQTTSNLAAINDFKGAVVAAAGPSDAIVGNVTTPAPASVSLGVTPTAFADMDDHGINGKVTFQMANGANVGQIRKAVIGIRNAAGNWVGGPPIVILTDVPPAAPALPRTYANKPFAKLQAPDASGAYNLWLRIVPATHNAEAIQSFMTAVVPAPTATDFLIAVVNVP